MEIIKTEVKPYRVTAYCDCGAELKNEENACGAAAIQPYLTTFVYKHICPNCGKIYYLDSIYPQIIF